MSCYNRCKVNRYPKDFRNIKDTPASFKSEAALEQEKKFQALLLERNQVAKPVLMKESASASASASVHVVESVPVPVPVPSHMTPWKTPSINS